MRTDQLSPDELAEQQFYQLIYTLFYVSFSGAIMSVVYFVFNYIYTAIRRRMVCSVQISSSDDIYKMVLDFLTQKGFLKGSMT